MTDVRRADDALGDPRLVIDQLRESIDTWAEWRGRSEEEVATLAPWAELWSRLIRLALLGPYKRMTADELRIEYNRHHSVYDKTLSGDDSPLDLHKQALRDSVLTWVEELGSRLDPDGRTYLGQTDWTALLIAARTLAAADSVAARLEARINDAVDTILDTRSVLDTKLERLNEAVAATTDAADRAQHAADEARKAAGEKGLDEFGEKFAAYAKTQLDAARDYRRWTIWVLVIALCVATVFVLEEIFHWGGLETNPDDWHSVVYRLAIVGGLSGLSAYLGRQSSQHRQAGDWASALEVQSRSFGAFVEPIADVSVKNSIYSAMSARLLAPPPDKHSTEQAVPAAAVDRIVDAIIRRGA